MRSALFLGALVLFAGLGIGVLGTSRSTLALVISVCRLDVAVLESPLPCLAIHAPKDGRGGYALLREPMHKERTILAPLADISGIEDPQLLSEGVPNFFADAWSQRHRLTDDNPSIDPWRDMALAINSRDNRSQDHLHIHIACIRPTVRDVLEHNLPAIPFDRFVRLNVRLQGRLYWASRIETENGQLIDPIRFVAENLPSAEADIGSLAIIVVGAILDGDRRGFYILVGDRDDRSGDPASTEKLLDPACLLPRVALSATAG